MSQLMTAIVTATQVWPADPGKFSGKVVGQDGTKWWVPASMVPQITKGATVTFEYDQATKQGANGPVTYNNVKRIVSAGQLPVSQPAPHANGSAAGKANSTAREMAVMGIVGRAMGSGQFNAMDVKVLMLAAAQAWDEVFG